MKVRWKFVLVLALAIVIGPCAIMAVAGGAQKLYASFVDFTEGTAYTAPSGHSGISFDSGTHKMKASLNGGAPVVVPTVGGGDIDLSTATVTGTAPIARGGTNSNTALSGSTIMVSNGTAIVQGSAGTTSTVLHGNAGGQPSYGAVALATEVSGDLALSNLAQGSSNSVLGVSGSGPADYAPMTPADANDIMAFTTTTGFKKIASLSAVNPSLTGSLLGYESPANTRVNNTTLGGLFNNGICQGRLTLTTDVPVTTSDVSSSSNVYFTPYNGNRVALYTSSVWQTYTFTQRTLALSGLNPGGIYDVFLYDNAGTLTLEAVSWTNTSGTVATGSFYGGATNDYDVASTSHGLSVGDTVWIYGTGGATGLNDKTYTVAAVPGANDFQFYYGASTPGVWSSNGTWRKTNVNRVTALDYQDGVLIKSGSPNKRYLGTFMAITSSTTCDTAQHRYLWNNQNRVPRKMTRSESIDSWSYTTAAFRLAGGSFDNMVDCIVGFGQENISMTCGVMYSNSTTSIAAFSSIGVNSAITSSADLIGFHKNDSTSDVVQARSVLNYLPTTPTLSTGTGHFIFNWLEYSTATGTATWYGDSGTPTTVKSGLSGMIRN